METEKSIERIQAEKAAMDESGHSELIADMNVNRQSGDDQNMQQGQKIFTSTKKNSRSGIILERTGK
jgi:hypothetical protein